MGDRRATATRRTVVTVLAAGSLVLSGATGVTAADSSTEFDERASSWDVAAVRLGTGGLALGADDDGGARTDAQGRGAGPTTWPFADGAVTAGDTYAGTRYGKGRKRLLVSEKWANTGWAAEPAYSTSMARVGSVKIRLGRSGHPDHRARQGTGQLLPAALRRRPDAGPQALPVREVGREEDRRGPHHDGATALADDGSRHDVDRHAVHGADVQGARCRPLAASSRLPVRLVTVLGPRRWWRCAGRWWTAP